MRCSSFRRAEILSLPYERPPDTIVGINGGLAQRLHSQLIAKLYRPRASAPHAYLPPLHAHLPTGVLHDSECIPSFPSSLGPEGRLGMPYKSRVSSQSNHLAHKSTRFVRNSAQNPEICTNNEPTSNSALNNPRSRHVEITAHSRRKANWLEDRTKVEIWRTRTVPLRRIPRFVRVKGPSFITESIDFFALNGQTGQKKSTHLLPLAFQLADCVRP